MKSIRAEIKFLRPDALPGVNHMRLGMWLIPGNPHNTDQGIHRTLLGLSNDDFIG